MEDASNMFSDNPEVQGDYRELWSQEWGQYPHKPAAQIDWDNQVSKAALHIARIDKIAANQQDAEDARPRVYDSSQKS